MVTMATLPTTTSPEPVEPQVSREAHVDDADVPAGGAPAPEPTDEHASREAASYRRRLRDTEAERDALRQRLDEYERRGHVVEQNTFRANGKSLTSLPHTFEFLATSTAAEALRTSSSTASSPESRYRMETPSWRPGVSTSSPTAPRRFCLRRIREHPATSRGSAPPSRPSVFVRRGHGGQVGGC
jgi:hypothetical protein